MPEDGAAAASERCRRMTGAERVATRRRLDNIMVVLGEPEKISGCGRGARVYVPVHYTQKCTAIEFFKAF